MAREKKTVHKVQMTDGKRQIIQQLLQEYDIETAEDIQDALNHILDLSQIVKSLTRFHRKSKIIDSFAIIVKS